MRKRFYVAPIDNYGTTDGKQRTWGVFDRSKMEYGGEYHACVADVDQRSTARCKAGEYNALDAFFVGLAQLGSS